jgi:methionine-rich copper-binding protein CopC
MELRVNHTFMSSVIRNAVCAGLLTLGLAAISAHAILVNSTPAPSEIVTGPNVPVVLTFNSKVDQARSALSLESPDHAISRLKVDVDPSSPGKLIARISSAEVGSYKLRSQVLSVDGHIDVPTKN